MCTGLSSYFRPYKSLLTAGHSLRPGRYKSITPGRPSVPEKSREVQAHNAGFFAFKGTPTKGVKETCWPGLDFSRTDVLPAGR